MKPLYLDRSSYEDKAFSINRHKYANFLKLWHYHDELELALLVQSTGTMFIGDYIGSFEKGDLILIGKDLPHVLLNDPIYFEEDSGLEAESLVVHFKEDFAGAKLFQLTEMKMIADLLERSRKGIQFFGKEKDEVARKIVDLEGLTGYKKMIALLDVLYSLAQLTDYRILSKTLFVDEFEKKDRQKLEPVYNFVFNNLKTGFGLNEVAELACMNPSAFSRYFKKVHGKTFTKYVNELRIGFACKLLLEGRYSITDICYESGFNNLSNFNRQFKAMTSYSPSDYMKKRMEIL